MAEESAVWEEEEWLWESARRQSWRWLAPQQPVTRRAKVMLGPRRLMREQIRIVSAAQPSGPTNGWERKPRGGGWNGKGESCNSSF